jgi:hypothetical protein
VKHDVSRTLMRLLIHCGTLNCPYGPKKSPAGSGDENSCFPFAIEKCVICRMQLVTFASFW